LAASVADQDPTADPTGAWAAGPDRAGVADAIDPRRLLAEVRRADASADVVVTYLHWGIQGERCPSADQRSLARRLVGAGADVVVGSHAHELQGDGRLGPGYVAYGLGNFAWYSPGPTGVLTLTVRPPLTPAGRARVTASRWWPATIGADGLASPDSGPAAAASHDRRRALRACAGLG
ncbi:MAG TPA: CapA family protein, partial [Nocardioides sp.]|nr:CapA family protein [Nocardioides sp.]